MPLYKTDTEKVRRLRAKRIKAAEDKKNAESRTKYGKDIVAKINLSLGMQKSLADYDPTAKLPVDFIRKPDFRDCPGLVAAHSSEENILKLLTCCGDIFGASRGVLGFDDSAFVGVVQVELPCLARLFDIAKSIHDSVLFCPEETDSIILVDHYKVAGVAEDEHFSLIVQGELLERRFANCFGRS